MDEILGGIFYFLGRFLIWFVFDIFFQTICWGIGWCILKVATLGKYPAKDTGEDKIALTGFMALLLLVITLMLNLYLTGD